MATFYIQLENKLLQISGELTAENISKALGYVPVSPSVTEELSQKIDSVSFDSLKDNPFSQDGNGELNIVDEEGNIIAKINTDGIHSIEFIAGNHKLTDKIDLSALNGYAKESWVSAEIVKAATSGSIDLTGYATEEFVNTKISEIDIPSLDGYATEEYVNTQGFLTKHQDIKHLVTKDEIYDIALNAILTKFPIKDDESGEFIVNDENGNIGLKLNSTGLYVKDVICGEHLLSNKADKTDIDIVKIYSEQLVAENVINNTATTDDIDILFENI